MRVQGKTVTAEDGPIWLSEKEIDAVRRFGFDLRTSVVTATGEMLEPWTTVGPRHAPGEYGRWERTADGLCEIVVLRGRYRARIFRVEPLALQIALGQ